MNAQDIKVHTLPYRVIVEEMNEGFLTLNEGTILYSNRSFAGMLRISLEDLIGHPMQNFIKQSEHERYVRLLQDAGKVGKKDEFTLIRSDGSEMPVRISAVPIKNDDFDGLCVVVTEAENALKAANVKLENQVIERTYQLSESHLRLRSEIEERKIANVKLRSSEERLRKIFNYAATGIAIIDLDGNFVQCNPACCSTLGYVPEELIQIKFPSLIHPVDRERNLSLMRQLMNQEIPSFNVESRYIKKEGGSVWMQEFVSLLRDESGKPTQLIALVNDITEHKRVEEELRKEREELKKINKEMETFIQIVSHDLRAPLRSIQTFTQIIHQDYCKQMQCGASETLSDIIQAVGSMNRLVEDLVKIYKETRIKRPYEPVDVEKIIRDISTALKGSIVKNNVEIQVPERVPLVHADPVRIHHIFQNLISNSVKYAVKKSDPVKIRVGYADRGDCHEFHVKDNGIGIDAAYFNKIFDPFSRLHSQEEYEGTGSGLYIVKKLVEDHKGEIWVNSKIGKGSTFYFKIPKDLENGNAIKDNF